MKMKMRKESAEEDVLQDEILKRAEHVFKMTARAPNGNIIENLY
jgi:hypothetical protein